MATPLTCGNVVDPRLRMLARSVVVLDVVGFESHRSPSLTPHNTRSEPQDGWTMKLPQARPAVRLSGARRPDGV
jgi:hypothetical protein